MEKYNIKDIQEYYKTPKLKQGTVLWKDEKKGNGIMIMYLVDLPIGVYFDSSTTKGFDFIKRHDLLRFEVRYKKDQGYFARNVRL